MPKTVPVFDLIQTLSPSEKRYFMIQAQMKGGRKAENYVSLFRTLEGLETYEEAEKKDLPKAQQPAVLRNYLFDQLLLSLRHYHRNSTVDMELRELLDRIELLEGRGLIKIWEKLLRKAWKKAAQFDKTAIKLELMTWRHRLARRRKSSSLAREIRELAATQRQLMQQLQVESELRLLHDELFVMVQTDPELKEKGARERLDEIMSLPEVAGENALSFDAKLVRGYLFVWRALLLNQAEGTEAAFRKMVEVWESHPHQVEDQKARYIRTLFSHLDSCFLCNRFDNYHHTLSLVRSLPKLSREQESMIFFLGHHLEIRYLVHQRDFGTALELTRKIEQGLEKYGPEWHHTVDFTIFYNLMLTCFLQAEHRKALDWVNRIRNHSKVEFRKDIQDAARRFELIIHLELGNLDLLEHLIRSARNYFRRRGNYKAFAKALLSSLGNYLRAHDESSRKQALALGLEELTRSETKALGTAEIIAWFRHKCTGEPVLKEV